MTNFLIFPVSLFKKNYLPKKSNKITYYLIEDPLYFGDKSRIKNFNKKKLLLHRASMKYYFDYLKDNDYNVKYIEYDKVNNYDFVKIKDDEKVQLFDPIDHLLVKRLKKKFDLEIFDTPLFLLNNDDILEYDDTKKSDTFFHKHFYDWQLKKLDIPYITKSYDTENRNAVPKDIDIPKIPSNKSDQEYIDEAKKYVEKHFENNYGDVEDFIFPVTHKTADKWLNDFLKKRLSQFGDYQDAILSTEEYLFHSLLSSVINIGLITPEDLVDKTIKYYEKNKKQVKINNFEGFIRQVIG